MGSSFNEIVENWTNISSEKLFCVIDGAKLFCVINVGSRTKRKTFIFD
jgi:hypothetical protein